MRETVARMLAKYEPKSVDDSVRALREIIQEVALLGLWRAKFFEHAAFYVDTVLRILYGLDRFSEDLDFSLLQPSADFNLARYSASLEEELQAFGFNVRMEMVDNLWNLQSNLLFSKPTPAANYWLLSPEWNLPDRLPPGRS